MPANATSYLDTGLTPGDTYSYEILASNTVGTTASNTYAVTTPVPPSAVSDLQPNSITTSSVLLTWTLNSTNDTGVQVLRRTNGAGPFSLVTTLATGTTSYTDSSLASGTEYEYNVVAINLAGSSPAADAGLTTLASPPTVTAGLQSGDVVLNWGAVNGALAYNVYRGLASGTEGASPYATVEHATTFTDTGVTATDTYYYYVTAVDFSGESVPSNEVSETIPAGGDPAVIDTPPQVVGVFVSGSSWSPNYENILAQAGVGGSLGYELAGGAGQLSNASTPGWIDLDTISIVFSKPVSGVTASSLTLGDSGNNGGTPSGITVGGESNPSSTVATFTLTGGPFNGELTSNKYYLDLAAAGITDAAGTELSGAWTTGSSTFAAGSGNGSPGGDFIFRFNVAAGDVNGDGKVNAADVTALRSQTTGADTASDWMYDLNGDGKINAADVTGLRSRATVSLAGLPEPILPSSGGPVVFSGPVHLNGPSPNAADSVLATSAASSTGGSSLDAAVNQILVSPIVAKVTVHPAWLAPSASGGASPDPLNKQIKAIEAILAWDAVFAEFGR